MTAPLGLFEGVGVELEYMIVDRETLGVRAVADRLLALEAGGGATDVERGRVAWSNELALHVLELKTNGPASELGGLARLFLGEVRHVNELLESLGARLMPGAMHPWMDPETETRLWPHEYNDVYRAFDRIFGCRGHGWANVQSTHLNLPFKDDEEFRVLHAAVRAVLPLIPGLAASSPVHDGRRLPWLDGRIEAYRGNAARIPSVSGRLIPEQVGDGQEYQREILDRIYGDLAPHDPDGILQHEWVNARGAIARFDRRTIEIRLVDSQENPAADLAVAAAIRGAVQWLTLDPPGDLETLNTDRLVEILASTTRHGDRAIVDDVSYLRALGYRGGSASAGRLWEHLVEQGLTRYDGSDEWAPQLEAILKYGCLARRLLSALGSDVDRRSMYRVWTALCDQIESDSSFLHTSTSTFTPVGRAPVPGDGS